jgi:hypothetical protein
LQQVTVVGFSLGGRCICTFGPWHQHCVCCSCVTTAAAIAWHQHCVCCSCSCNTTAAIA